MEEKNQQLNDDFLKEISNEINKEKQQFINEINERGEEYLYQIDKKNQKKEDIKTKQISYILKKSNNYDEDELKSYHYDDVNNIYNRTKENNKSPIIKILQFLFNV